MKRKATEKERKQWGTKQHQSRCGEIAAATTKATAEAKSGKEEWDERDVEEEGGDRLAHQRQFCFAKQGKVKSELQQRLLLGSKEEDKSGKEEGNESDEEKKGGDRLAHLRQFCFAKQIKVKSELQRLRAEGSQTNVEEANGEELQGSTAQERLGDNFVSQSK
jgi:hypothetical protein